MIHLFVFESDGPLRGGRIFGAGDPHRFVGREPHHSAEDITVQGGLGADPAELLDAPNVTEGTVSQSVDFVRVRGEFFVPQSYYFFYEFREVGHR